MPSTTTPSSTTPSPSPSQGDGGMNEPAPRADRG
jgi:hypothetical protein